MVATELLPSRERLALDHIAELISSADRRARKALHVYYVLQGLTMGLAALTPCLIFLSRDNPANDVLVWLQLFFPAVAALTAGIAHVCRWREDGVVYVRLAESIRSQLWRFQTRSGEYRGLVDDDALDRLVTRVDELNLQSLARWSSLTSSERVTPGSGGGAWESNPPSTRKLAEQLF